MKLSKKHIIIIAVIAFAIVIAIAAAIVLPIVLRGYKINKTDNATDMDVPKELSLYSADNIGFSFLYPVGLETGWNEEDGAYIYCGSSHEAPYVLVCRTNKSGMTPEKYFKSFDQSMLQTFENVQSTKIQEVQVGEKTLYLTRYMCADGSKSYVIDRYLELYNGFYIQYSSISEEAGSLNTPLYYAISTLKIKDGAYQGAFSDKTTLYHHAETGISLKLPDMLVVNDLTIGYFASNENAVMICVHCTEDDGGTPIYNRQDFIDRASASPDFVATRLGADSAEFSEGQELQLGNKSFYCYPMKMSTNGNAFSGVLCLANADETGCWLLCYAVREGCPAQEDISAILENCAESIEFK